MFFLRFVPNALFVMESVKEILHLRAPGIAMLCSGNGRTSPCASNDVLQALVLVQLSVTLHNRLIYFTILPGKISDVVGEAKNKTNEILQQRNGKMVQNIKQGLDYM